MSVVAPRCGMCLLGDKLASATSTVGVHVRCWFMSGAWLASGAALGGLGGLSAVFNNKENLALQRASYGALVGMTAPVSLPVLLPYWAFIKTPPSRYA